MANEALKELESKLWGAAYGPADWQQGYRPHIDRWWGSVYKNKRWFEDDRYLKEFICLASQVLGESDGR